MDEFILALFQGNYKLKKTTMYQLLIGKGTTSVLSYGFFYDQLKWFGSFPQLPIAEFDKILNQLTEKKKIQVDSEGYVVCLVPTEVPNYFSEIDFFHYGKKADQAWRATLFLIQIASFLGNKKNYQPLETTPFYTEYARQFVQQHKEILKQEVYHSLTTVLSQLDVTTADFIAQMFSGWQQNGAVYYQLLPKKFQSYPKEKLYLSNAQHAFFRTLQNNPKLLLTTYINPILLENYNQSARLTKELLLSGRQLEEIATLRRIKKGTVSDHLIYWAIEDPNFPFENYLDSNLVKSLPDNSWNLPYKELLQEGTFSFLDLKLAQIKQKRQEIK